MWDIDPWLAKRCTAAPLAIRGNDDGGPLVEEAGSSV
jgi:hypothetical protein